jgi:hypothetical protein
MRAPSGVDGVVRQSTAHNTTKRSHLLPRHRQVQALLRGDQVIAIVQALVQLNPVDPAVELAAPGIVILGNRCLLCSLKPDIMRALRPGPPVL